MIVIVTLTFTLILHTFQRNLKRFMFFDNNDVNFNTRLSLLKQYAISQNSVITEEIKRKFSNQILSHKK